MSALRPEADMDRVDGTKWRDMTGMGLLLSRRKRDNRGWMERPSESSKPVVSKERKRAMPRMSGPCSQASGTFLTTNTLGGGNALSRSLLVLADDGHALRFDSDEMMAAADCRAFGDSAGNWRCDGVEDDGTVRITLVMLDFTYPGPRGEDGQIVRLDVSGRYDPTTSILDLEGSLGIWPMEADAEEIASSAQAPASMGITLRCAKIKPPPPAH
jgi:hypothetical protein